MAAQQSKPNLQISEILHDIDSDSYFLRFQFLKLGGETGVREVPRSLQQDVSKIHELLLSAGALLPTNRTEALTLINQAIAGSLENAIIEYTRVTGWRSADTFIARGWTVGRSGTRHLDRADFDVCQGVASGTLDAWKSGLSEPCAASSFLCFAIGTAFAAPLLDMIDEEEGAVFHLRGSSSSGKSLIQRAAQSCFGRVGKNDLPTFDITQTGLEEWCWSRNDLLLCIDEHGRLETTHGASSMRQFAYMIAGGRGRIRTQGTKQQYPDRQWKLIGFSSGEMPLESGAISRNDGERARLIDTPVPHRSDGGVFDNPDIERQGEADSNALARMVERTISQNYGVALKPYVARLVRYRSKARTVTLKFVDQFIVRAEATDPWERRFATKFALVAAAMGLAANLRIAPWRRQQGANAALRVYRMARKAIFSPAEGAEKFLADVRKCLADRRLVPILEECDALQPDLRETAIGFRRRHSRQGDIIALRPDWCESKLGSKVVARKVMKSLLTNDVAVKSPDGKTRPQIAVSGFDRVGRSRWIFLHYKKVIPG